MDVLIRLSAQAVEEVRPLVGRRLLQLRDTRAFRPAREVQEQLQLKGARTSTLLVLELEPGRLGMLDLVCSGHGRHTPAHLAWLEARYEPLASILRHLLAQLEIARLKERIVFQEGNLQERLEPSSLGRQPGLRGVLGMVANVAPLEAPVILLGETGTGKEVLAHEIHRQSRRRGGPMVSVNCGAIPETLLDSELFGYEKGAFTGAAVQRKGYFEQADQGTIFLDELGELSLSAQVKLLRVVQTMSFQRVGGSRNISVDARIIAATNRDLARMVEARQFREDLWFRINVFPIAIPPLRERKDDIPILAEGFARRKAAEMNLPFSFRFAHGAMEQLRAYDWPGNVRELQNVIERALIVSRGDDLTFGHLAPAGQPEFPVPAGAGPWLSLDEAMDQYIRLTLARCGGRINGPGGAADRLKINPSTLRGRMRKLGIRLERQLNDPF